MKIWNARAVRAKCAELSTFEKNNIQLFIFHWETNSILGSRSEKKDQVFVDLSKNTSMALEVNFRNFRNKNLNWFLSQFVVIYFWPQVVNYDFFGVNLNKSVQKKRWATF